MSESNIVCIFFADTIHDLDHWQDVIAQQALDKLGEIIPNDIKASSKSGVYHAQLDSNGPPDTEGRVFQLTYPVPQPFTLRQCKAITDSPSFQAFQTTHQISMLIRPEDPYYKLLNPRGLAVFDMDSTLIQQEVIDELARAVGLYDQVAAITEAAMRGEEPYTDFEASLRARVALLKGVPTSIWETMKRDVITFTPGAPELIRALRNLGWKTAVLSGGFTPLAEWVKETLGLDYAFANHLVADEDSQQLTGELVPEAPIIHGRKKRELLLRLAEENGIPTERVVAVGDGSNDLPMMDAAGLGIAFNAKPKVQMAAPTKLNSSSLLDVLYVLGYQKGEIDKALAP